MRYLVIAVAATAFFVSAGAALAAGSGAPSLANVVVVDHAKLGGNGNMVSGGGGGSWPSGCRDVDVYTSQTSWLFGTTIYRFHQYKHWCWGGGGIYDERHAWGFEGSSTACFQTVYPPNAWYFTWWNGIGTSGHYSEERAHVTNCIFHFGDWKEFYPDVKIWSYANGSYDVDTSN